MGVHLFAELENELIKAQVHFALYLQVHVLFAEVAQRVVGTVIVQVHRVQQVAKQRRTGDEEQVVHYRW